MNNLATALASIIRDKARHMSVGRSGGHLETRVIFHGPPLEFLEMVYEDLMATSLAVDGEAGPPVLLQVPAGQPGFSNPGIGMSGRCDETHLLDLRNVPACPSFIALVPPGQHSNMSVSSTTDEFGLNARNNTGHATFEEWWGDPFLQALFEEALTCAGFEGDQHKEAISLVENAARAMDEVDPARESRTAGWYLLSRLFSIQDCPGISKAEALSIACGMPRPQDEVVNAKNQIGVLQEIAEALSEGFRAGIDRARLNASEDDARHLEEFLTHIQDSCDVPTAFERATPAFYLPADTLDVQPPPAWWKALTAEKWSELLSEEPEETNSLVLECRNPAFPVLRGAPVLVREEVELSISTGLEIPVDVLLERSAGGARGKSDTNILVQGTALFQEDLPKHKSPATYKLTSPRFKKTTLKIVSLASWAPGIFVTCRLALKLSHPKPPARRSARAGFDWESSLSVPGAGRYELAVFLAPGITIGKEATGIQDDATEIDAERNIHPIMRAQPDVYQIEIEADGRYQVDIPFQRQESDGLVRNEVCRVYVTCEETTEEGCRSEFERLIRLNRRHLERFDTKAVIQLDRNARSSSLQSWILDEQNITKSYRPLVIANDLATSWATPDWDQPHGPILSQGRFLHDPRPAPHEFQPPSAFLMAREAIAEMVRSSDDQSGLLESAPLGRWLLRDPKFVELVELYLTSYSAWLGSAHEIACWVDVVAVASLEQDGRTLSRVPDAILLSPLHPLRLAWHCVAQRVLQDTLEGNEPCPCPAASVLDPGCIPDLLTLSLQAPGGTEDVDFLSIESNSDYWSVLWNGSKLRQLSAMSRQSPFDGTLGITIGGISSGFSSAQVSRALEDVSNLLAAKPIVSLVVSAAGGITDACNEGLVTWCTSRFSMGERASLRQGVGPRRVHVYDTRAEGSRPDDATIANLSEDTNNQVCWYIKQPAGAKPDLGIIAQLDSSEPETTPIAMRSPLGHGGLIRHRVRRQLPGGSRAFLSESRQGLQMPPSGDILADKVSACMLALENRRSERVGLRFAPSIHAVSAMLEEHKADFVAVSSSAIDPACFLGGWLPGAYLWDYDLPSYSHRAGDTNGYYLLSQVKASDRDSLKRVLSMLPQCDDLEDKQVDDILLEVARRGIPTIRGLSGDDTGATGDLGLFLAVRLLQDKFRTANNSPDSLLPVISGSNSGVSIALVIPVDPFRGYLSDLARSFGKDRKEISLSRPDLLVVGILIHDGNVRIHLTPIEVKCRQGYTLSSPEVEDALRQAKALSLLLSALAERSTKSLAWRLASQHLLLSMIGFGFRVYSQHKDVSGEISKWSLYHEQVAASILGPSPAISIDPRGRLVVIDESLQSYPCDRDSDGVDETIILSSKDAGRIVAGEAQALYDAVRLKVGDWLLLPRPVDEAGTGGTSADPGALEVTPTRDTAGTENAAHLNPHLRGVTDGGDLVPPLQQDEQVASPSCLPHQSKGVILSVGRTSGGFEPRNLSLNISDTRLNQLNIGVVGDLGTGKTQLLKSLILQIAKSRDANRGIAPRFLIFDYKRDYSSADFVEATGARVVKPTRLPLNMFDTSSMADSPVPWLDRFRFFADVLDKIYTGIGPVQRDKLKNAVRNAYAASDAEGRHPSIYDIHHAYRQLLGGKSDSPMAIIDDLVDMEIFSRDPGETVPFDTFFDGVIVISLDAMGQDDRSKNMLVAIMLNMFYENMLRTPKRPFEGSNPQLRVIDSYLLVDEADNIMRYEFDVLRKLLLQGREFGAGVVLASQYLRHFKVSATDYREPLLTWFIHKVPNVTPAELGALGFTSDLTELSDRVKTLHNHHCLYKSFDVAGEVIRGLPFYELAQRGDAY